MKVKIYNNNISDSVDILFYEERPDYSKVVASPIKLIMKEYKEGEDIQPTLQLAGHLAEPLLHSLTQALKDFGVRTKQDEVNEGELKSTKYHLEDLRKLLKLTDNYAGRNK